MNIAQFYNARICARSGQAGFRHKFIVAEGQAGLVYRHGVFVRQISAGRHVIWGFGWTVNTVDLRKTSVVVPGQEVLTSDSVGLKLSLLMTYHVADPAKAAHESQNWYSDLYNAAQLAARAVVGGVTVEALLTQRLDIAHNLRLASSRKRQSSASACSRSKLRTRCFRMT